jgi:hypothetical protein
MALNTVGAKLIMPMSFFMTVRPSMFTLRRQRRLN